MADDPKKKPSSDKDAKSENPPFAKRVLGFFTEQIKKLIAKVKTPPEILFCVLLLLGILTVPFASFMGVGRCTIDNATESLATSDSEPIVGGAIVNLRSVDMRDDIIIPGACGIISSVDYENGTVRVFLLAKPLPIYTPSPEEYSPLSTLLDISDEPVETLLFLHGGISPVDIPFEEAAPIYTHPLTNLARNFYLNIFYIPILILLALTILLTAIGRTFKRKREEWYARHTLRATYRARLMQNRQKTDELRYQWNRATALTDETDVERVKARAALLNETLDEILTLLEFEGDNIDEKLKRIKKEDLATIEQLDDMHALLRRIENVEGNTRHEFYSAMMSHRGKTLIATLKNYLFGIKWTAMIVSIRCTSWLLKKTAPARESIGKTLKNISILSAFMRGKEIEHTDTPQDKQKTTPTDTSIPKSAHKIVQRAEDTYKESFILLGLLEYWD